MVQKATEQGGEGPIWGMASCARHPGLSELPASTLSFLSMWAAAMGCMIPGANTESLNVHRRTHDTLNVPHPKATRGSSDPALAGLWNMKGK